MVFLQSKWLISPWRVFCGNDLLVCPKIHKDDCNTIKLQELNCSQRILSFELYVKHKIDESPKLHVYLWVPEQFCVHFPNSTFAVSLTWVQCNAMWVKIQWDKVWERAFKTFVCCHTTFDTENCITKDICQTKLNFHSKNWPLAATDYWVKLKVTFSDNNSVLN